MHIKLLSHAHDNPLQRTYSLLYNSHAYTRTTHIVELP